MEHKQKKGIIISSIIISIILLIVVISSFVLPHKNNTTTDAIETKDWNENFTFEDIDFCFTGYTFKYFADGGSYPAGENHVWVIINATLLNNTSKKIDLSNITTDLIYLKNDEEAKYNSFYFSNSRWIMSHEYIEPYEKIEGIFMYKIPTTIAPAISGYDYSIGGKFEASSCQNLNFEFRLKKNLKDVKNYISIKL